MTQHIFNTEYQGRPVRLLSGWDRPLRAYFLVIEFAGDEEEDESYLYSNLSDPNLITTLGMCRDLAYFQEVLGGFGIVVPESMLSQIELDQLRNTGNAVTHWDAEGNPMEMTSTTH